MKRNKLLYVLIIVFIFGCSSDDTTTIIEDGTNPAPNLKSTGSSAHDFLSSDDYGSLAIEVLYVHNFRPNSETLNNLQQFMQARLNKPDGVTITEREIDSPGGDLRYEINDITDLEAATRTKYNNINVLTLYILFIDGAFSTDTSTNLTLGTAYRNTSCVIYENSVVNLSNRPNGPDRTMLESTVLLHELSHLLGLVDLGSPMQHGHRDDEHGRHCNNENCLMYWQTQSNVMHSGIPTVPQLDENCLLDLKANGGK